jgi:acyl transferase domain-containing protein
MPSNEFATDGARKQSHTDLNNSNNDKAASDKGFVQEPVAIVGFACRLPGHNRTPRALWSFLEQGGVASNVVSESRFNVKGHYDGSMKPGTMRPPGGMFIEDTELEVFDASFFEISRAEAISMDPNQRQLLEVIYEGLENAGIPLKSIDGAPVGCFVGSYASGKIISPSK